jgi:sugar phosphate isomerase/epimerase
MNNNFLADRLAVCSWSLQPADPEDLVAKLLAGGLRRVQLALDPLRESPQVWNRTETLLRQNNIAIVSGMFGCVGEDYTTLESIRRTGGIAPEATWERNCRNIEETAGLAARMGLKLITFHAGFIPHLETDPDYARMLSRLARVAGMFAGAGIALGLETGQEAAPALAALLQRLRQPNVGVNFDPANMILYDQGDPVAALRVLAPWIRQVHIKDATRTKVAGTWGEEVAAGAGDVDWRAFFATLAQLNFKGNFVIEREAGTRRVPDVILARAVVEKNFAGT